MHRMLWRFCLDPNQLSRVLMTLQKQGKYPKIISYDAANITYKVFVTASNS